MGIIPAFEIKGIKFFSNRSDCISHFEESPWLKKILSLLQSFGTLFAYGLYKVSLFFSRPDDELDSFAALGPKDCEQKKLIVCLHGLNNDRHQFKKLKDQLQNQTLTEASILIPDLPDKGRDKLNNMVDILYRIIEKWAEKPVEKELVLVGISNGGRVAKALIAKIANSKFNAKISRIRFVSIVGACKGSSLVNFINKIGLSCLISKNIAQEMSPDVVNEQHKAWEQALEKRPNKKDEYVLIASPHDWQVPNYDSSLMKVAHQNAYYAVVPGHGHNSIVNATAEIVNKIILSSNLSEFHATPLS
jgi:hypothetical protein